ncbi:MAG TPA: ribosome small subunit-dependent GTPase A [Vicinamibacterales bacterium]|jgi:ribosome biogenesis GTPase|nr:ribosome small subunit-dependent GTPase A [Vicinamibacterales bacterium]
MSLAPFGWDEGFADLFAAALARRKTDAARARLRPGRVTIEFNHNYRIVTDAGEIDAVLAGRVKHHATTRADLPAVGDWVVVRKHDDEDRGAIVAVLDRRSRFSRRMAGDVTDEQVVAANVDVVFIVMALDDDFSVRRLERYLLMARESGATPVIVLTKPDLATDLAAQVADAVTIASAVPVHVVNPRKREGLDLVAQYLSIGRTGTLLGSSGVGKSTIINGLVGADVQKTREVRAADSKGRHTTTHRELVRLPGGGLLIDTPGMRELQLWEAPDGIRETFDDIEALAAGCRFTDCRHRDEPGCAVKQAVEAGDLPASRLESYHRLQDELAFLARQQDERALIEEKRRGRIGAKALRQHLKMKR